MRIAQDRMTFDTTPREIKEITRDLAEWTARQGVVSGLLSVFIRHTSASLLIQENYSPDVRRDLETFLDRLAPEDPSRYRHNDEGPDDMPAHLKAMLTQVTLTIPGMEARLQLGTWKGVFPAGAPRPAASPRAGPDADRRVSRGSRGQCF